MDKYLYMKHITTTNNFWRLFILPARVFLVLHISSRSLSLLFHFKNLPVLLLQGSVANPTTQSTALSPTLLVSFLQHSFLSVSFSLPEGFYFFFSPCFNAHQLSLLLNSNGLLTRKEMRDLFICWKSVLKQFGSSAFRLWIMSDQQKKKWDPPF